MVKRKSQTAGEFFKIENFFFYWLPVIGWFAAIFYFSSQSHFNIVEKQLFDFIIFKFLHMIEYGFLYFLVFRAFFKTSSFSQSKILFYSLLIGIVYAVSDEYHQSFVPTREGRIKDVVIDTVGMLMVYWFIRNQFIRIKKYVV